MTAVSIDIPTGVLADFVAMVKAEWPETAAYTNKQCYLYWLRKRAGPELAAYRKRKVDASAYQAAATALAEAETEKEAARVELYAAQAAAEAQAVTDIGGIA